ncbi:hypothetical protein [Streptacidiphilus sp. P02-A3a]|uniref:hypothetical protein n=1 Tax=Streptacidiphilus sp. P02-A3a TaxID=2704468 RepID=UPI0015FD648E|nr:hypothetical protein [Streptacidiphilus sp. P02-A3a]QMU67238.1 hypothetical protein GXP74_02460 [Streptacidiphilus sp. P02-A3a]
MPIGLDSFMHSITPQRDPINLFPSIGVHRLTLGFTTREMGDNGPLISFSGELWAEDIPGTLGWISPLTQPEPLNTRYGGDNLRLNASVTDEQLRRLEQARASRDLTLRADLVGVRLDATGTSWPVGQCQVRVSIPHAEWSKKVEQLDAGAYVDVLVPITQVEGRAIAARRIREAQLAIRNGDYEGAVGKARSALDAVRPACNTEVIYNRVMNRGSKAKERTQEERWAVLIQSAYQLFSGAPHDDQGTTEHFTWTRADAVAAVATSAGLLARLADLP